MSETGVGKIAYRCSIPWSDHHSPVLVICCSDNRFIAAVGEFLSQGLGIPRADHYVVPGGPACLALSSFTLHDYDLARKRIQMLVELHHIRRAVLIAHQDCGFYGAALPEAGDAERRAIQHAHLQEGARVLRAWVAELQVECYYAEVQGGRVVFVEG